MKLLSTLLLISIYLASSDASCSDWSTRMLKYADLVNCEHYSTKSTKFKHFFALDDLHVRASNDFLYSFGFSTLTQKTIRFQLAEDKEDETPRPGMSTTEYAYDSEDDWETSTYSNWPEEQDPPPRYEDRFFTTYTIVIGSVEEEAAWQGNRQTSNAVVESFIDKGDKRIRTLVTPNIIRTNEPNEVRVDLFKDGRFRITINDATTIETRLQKISGLKYYSFAALKSGEETEFFHNCKLNLANFN